MVLAFNPSESSVFSELVQVFSVCLAGLDVVTILACGSSIALILTRCALCESRYPVMRSVSVWPENREQSFGRKGDFSGQDSLQISGQHCIKMEL